MRGARVEMSAGVPGGARHGVDAQKDRFEVKSGIAKGQAVDVNPTDAQKEAGNYPKAHVRLEGMDLSIENPTGSKRRGTDADGTPWETTMTMDYKEHDVVCPQCNTDLSVFRQIDQLTDEEAAEVLSNIERIKAEVSNEAAMTKDRQKFDRTIPANPHEQRGAIERIVDFAKRVKNRVERAVIVGITARQKKDFELQGIHGIDDTWVHSFESSAVAHNQNRHGNSKVEEQLGQIAITAEDYERIPEILEDYDRVTKSPNRSCSTGNEVLIYEKEFDDGYIYYLEEKRDKRKSLSFQTMYKKRKGADSSDGLMLDASPSTPATPSDNLSSNSEGKVNALSGDKQAPFPAVGKSENLGVHLAVLKSLPEVIEESVEAEVHPDYYKGYDGKRGPENGYNPDTLIHRFYGAARIDGDTYRIKTTIKETRDDKLRPIPHSYEVTKIELLPEDSSSGMEPTVSPQKAEAPHGIVKLLKDVEKSYDPGKISRRYNVGA